MPSYVSNDLTGRERLVVKAMADCSLRITAAARVLHMSPKGVYCCVDKIVDKTGLDPRVFYDLEQLLELVEEQSA